MQNAEFLVDGKPGMINPKQKERIREGQLLHGRAADCKAEGCKQILIVDDIVRKMEAPN